MIVELEFGTASRVRLTLPQGVEPAIVRAPRGEPLTDLPAAVAAALAEPLDMPPFVWALAPGDQVVLALDPGIEPLGGVVAGIATTLCAAGVAPEGITCLLAEHDARDPRASLPPELAAEVRLVRHRPDDRNSLAYLGADAAAEPIYLARALLDADVVLPTAVGGGAGPFGSIYPEFSDAAAKKRLARADFGPEGGDAGRRAADEVGWLLGAPYALYGVPAGGGGWLAACAGRPSAAWEAAAAKSADAWTVAPPPRCELVVAAMSGDASQQTWDQLGRVVAAAAELVVPQGTLVVLSELNVAPGPVLRTVLGQEDPWDALRQLQKMRPAEVPQARRFATALAAAHVYLRSRLPAEAVEDLGLAHLADDDELQRLLSHAKSVAFLPHAQQLRFAAG